METLSIPESEIKPVDPLEKLRPFEITDADGAQRQVFTFKIRSGGEVQAVFYQKEDLPFSAELLKDRQGFVLGDATNFRDINEWHQFLSDVQQTSVTKGDPKNIYSFSAKANIEQGRAVFFVENNPVHLLDLAFILGLNDPKWRDARKKAAIDREYTPEVLDMIDNLIAAAEVDDDGQLIRRRDQRGEALTVLSLLGDKKAADVVRKKRAVIDKWDKEKEEEKKDYCEYTAKTLQERGIKIKEEGYTATHSTKYKPRITPEGVKIRSAFDGSGGKSLRNTVHFSLEGPVLDWLGGKNWKGMDYIIRGDLAKIREANGNPRRMGEVDTYFSVAPGGYLTIPDAQVTMPGILADGQVRKVEGNITYYKKPPYSPADINSFYAEAYDNDTWSQEYADRGLESVITNGVAKIRYEKMQTFSEPSEGHKFNLEDGNRTQAWLDKVDVSQFIDEMRTNGIGAAIQRFVDLTPRVLNEDEVESVNKSVEAWLTTKIRNGYFWESSGQGEGTIESQQVVLQAALWGAVGDESRKPHGNDPEGLGREIHGGYKVFKALSAAKENLERYDQQVAANPDGFHSPRDMHEMFVVGEGPDRKWVNFNDRVGIMEAVRLYRGYLYEDKNIRRVSYVAGLI